MPPMAGGDTGGPARPITLLIADDQPLIRRGLAMMLAAEPGIEVLAQAADGIEAIELALQHRPDVVVMDLQMPRASGVVATRRVKASLPDTAVVALSTYDDDELVFEAIRAGAQAYLLKDASEAEILETIRSVHRGESRLSPVIARKVIEQFRTFASAAGASSPPGAAPQPSRLAGSPGDDAGAAAAAAEASTGTTACESPEQALTERESQILDLISEGLSNKQIAAAVFLAEGTVKNYVSRIMEKWHARNRLELAMRSVSRRSG